MPVKKVTRTAETHAEAFGLPRSASPNNSSRSNSPKPVVNNNDTKMRKLTKSEVQELGRMYRESRRGSSKRKIAEITSSKDSSASYIDGEQKRVRHNSEASSNDNINHYSR